MNFLSNLSFLQDYKKKWDNLPRNKKTIIKFTALFVLVALIPLSIFLGGDDKDNFKKASESFVQATAKYDVDAATKLTTGTARQLIISQSQKINKAKGAGYKTTIDKMETTIISQQKSRMTAKVVADATEQKNGTAQKYTHVFLLSGQKVGSTWKISSVLETQTKYNR